MGEMEKEGSEVPTGLRVLAAANCLIAVITLLALIVISLPFLLSPSDQGPGLYQPVISALSVVLLFLSGWGFAWGSYRWGYLLGNGFAVFSVLNIITASALEAFKGFTGILPSLSYPVILLLLLNLRYRAFFLSRRDNPE